MTARKRRVKQPTNVGGNEQVVFGLACERERRDLRSQISPTLRLVVSQKSPSEHLNSTFRSVDWTFSLSGTHCKLNEYISLVNVEIGNLPESSAGHACQPIDRPILGPEHLHTWSDGTCTKTSETDDLQAALLR